MQISMFKYAYGLLSLNYTYLRKKSIIYTVKNKRLTDLKYANRLTEMLNSKIDANCDCFITFDEFSECLAKPDLQISEGGGWGGGAHSKSINKHL